MVWGSVGRGEEARSGRGHRVRGQKYSKILCIGLARRRRAKILGFLTLPIVDPNQGYLRWGWGVQTKKNLVKNPRFEKDLVPYDYTLLISMEI